MSIKSIFKNTTDDQACSGPLYNALHKTIIQKGISHKGLMMENGKMSIQIAYNKESKVLRVQQNVPTKKSFSVCLQLNDKAEIIEIQGANLGSHSNRKNAVFAKMVLEQINDNWKKMVECRTVNNNDHDSPTKTNQTSKVISIDSKSPALSA